MMYKNIFDTHAHYDDEKFNEDRDSLLSSLNSLGVSNIINCGCDLKSSIDSVKLSEKYDYIFAAVGVHAQQANEATENDFCEIKKLFENEKVVAVGEIGLDYYYDYCPKDRQIKVLKQQLIFANELSLPVIIHDREAHEDTMKLLEEYKPRGVIHCFSGSVEMAKDAVKLGMFIGMGGAVTFKNARKPVEVMEYVPIENLVLETDSPYMTPVPFRGKRCDSSLIAYSAEKIAQIKHMDTQALIDACNKNAHRLFNLKKV